MRTLADAIEIFNKNATGIKSGDDRRRHLKWWRNEYGNRKLFHFTAPVVDDGRATLATENIERNPNDRCDSVLRRPSGTT